MRKVLIVGLLLMTTTLLKAQINAVTETGDQVILYDDGSWKYMEGSGAAEDFLVPINKKKFVKDDNSTFLIKSTKLDIGAYIDPKAWSFSKGTDQDEFEFQFQLKNEDLYGMLITERMQIPLKTLKVIALDNAKTVSPDIKVVKEEYRNVNGIKVLMMQMSGTIQGMKFFYYGYYYSDENGTLQFLTYTGETLLKEYQDDIELFLNGLVIL